MKVKNTNWIASKAEDLGIEGIWIGEDIDLGQDVYVLTTAALLQAPTARVGTAIMPITVHQITTLARAAVTMQHSGKGRFVFGTGIGGIQDLRKLGIHVKKPVTELRTSIQVLKRLWAGESVSVESELMSLDNYNLGFKDSVAIPIFLGVRGPEMLKLAGQEADGVVLSGPVDYLKDAVQRVNRAAKEVGRKSEDVEKVAWIPTIPTFKGADEKLAKTVVALVVADMPQQVIDILDVDVDRIDKIRAAVAKDGPSEGVHHVDQEILDAFSISGDRTYMVDRFEAIADLGITEVVLGPPFSGNWREAMIEIFQEIANRQGI